MSTVASGTNTGTASSGDGSSDSNALPQDKVLTITFNQDCTALAMGTVRSYSLFTLSLNNGTDETHDCGIKPLLAAKHFPFEEVHIIERVLSKSFIAVVTKQTPRQINVLDILRGTELYAYKFPTKIVAVKINRSKLIVCLEENIWIHAMRDMKVAHIIRDVPTNNVGLCALSLSNENPYLAYPGNSTIGKIQIFDINNLKPGVMINAHDGPLVAMSFDMSGTRIATASDKGTVIRIYSAVDGSRLFDFRRGSLRSAIIHSLAFSPDSMFLAASGSTGTIHIFRLADPTTSTSQEASTWMGSIGRVIGSAAYYLPKQSSEVFTQDRSFATVHLQSAELKTTIAMNNLNGKLILYVAGYDGVVSTYEVNTTDGGECKRISEDLLFNISMSSNNKQSTVTNARRNTTDEPSGEYPPNYFRNDNEAISKSST